MRRIIRTLALILLVVPFIAVAVPQAGKSNPKKVERIRAKKEKEARRQYEKDVKRHMNNQSKETRAMMKKAKKNSQKTSPVKPASGKKCP